MSEKKTTKTVEKPHPSSSKKSRGLGRGLDALLGDRPVRNATREEGEQESVQSSVRKPIMPSQPQSAPSTNEATISPNSDSERLSDGVVPIEFLRANPSQPRKIFDEAAIAELATSIKARGLLQPILVRPIRQSSSDHSARYEIVAGERRWRASQKAGLHEVHVVIRDLDDQQTAEIGLIENIQRVDLNPMEEAEAYHYLSKIHGRNQEDISKAVGKSRSHVANMMRLTSLTKSARDALSEGLISAGHARALLSSPTMALHLAETLNKGLSVRQLEGLVKQDNPKKKNPKHEGSLSKNADPSKDADTRALERDLAEALGLEVVLNHKKSGGGSLTIEYLDLDQLDHVCQRLMGSNV